MKQNAGKISNDEIKLAIDETVGVKAGKKIKIFKNKDEAVQFNRENNLCSDEELEQTYNAVLGFTAPSRYKRSSGILIRDDITPEALTDLPPGILPNVITHEVQHAMSYSFGKLSLEKALGRFSLGRKILDNRYQRLNNIHHQEKYMAIQELALEEKFGRKTDNLVQVLKELLWSKGILNPNDNKNNNLLLHYLISVYKDEARSYTVGCKIGDAYAGITTNQGKLLSDLYDDIVKALKQEKRHVQLNRIKSFFGFKPNNRRELDMIENVRLREEARLAKMQEAKSVEVSPEDMPKEVLDALS